MGNDGGTIAKRLDIISLYKQGLERTDISDEAIDVSKCKLSQRLLKGEKAVADYKGNVYLKEEVLKCLLEKSYKTKSAISHIRSLNDVVEIKPLFKNDEIICPITLSSEHLIYLRGCGCVLNHKTLKYADKTCVQCKEPFEEVDVVYIAPSIAEADTNEANMKTLKLKDLAHNKNKRKHKRSEKEGSRKKPKLKES